MFILVLCGAAAWTTEVNIARPREGLGGRSPPRNKYVHSGVVRRSRRDDDTPTCRGAGRPTSD